MKTDLYNLEGKVVGTVEVPDGLFGGRWRPALVRQALVAESANARRPWAHAKGRGEVRGGGRKPWRQKGTGRARHGSIRSPLWIGGGKAHGPSKERSYEQKVNRTMRRLAFASALSRRFRDGSVKIFDTLEISEPKTKRLFSLLGPILKIPKRVKKVDLIMIKAQENKNLARAGRNLVKIKIANAGEAALSDILNYRHIFIDQSAVSDLKRRAVIQE